MARIDVERQIDLIAQRIADLERDAGTEPHRHPEVEPLESRASADFAILRVVMNQEGQKFILAQRIKYTHDPPREGVIEPVGTRFEVYPMPGATYGWYFQMGFVYPGEDDDPIGADAFTFTLWADPKGNLIAYPDPRFDPSPIDDFAPRV